MQCDIIVCFDLCTLFTLDVMSVIVCLSLFTWVFWFVYFDYTRCVICQCVPVFVYLSELTGCFQLCVLCSHCVLCSGWSLCGYVVVFWLALGCEFSLWVDLQSVSVYLVSWLRNLEPWSLQWNSLFISCIYKVLIFIISK